MVVMVMVMMMMMMMVMMLMMMGAGEKPVMQKCRGERGALDTKIPRSQGPQTCPAHPTARKARWRM
eukprot:11211450-Karenia_brevis.AAC.1